MIKSEPTCKDVRKSIPGSGNSNCKGPGAEELGVFLEMTILSGILGDFIGKI